MNQPTTIFPFERRLSFQSLIDYWREMVQADLPIRSNVAKELLAMIEAVPALCGSTVKPETVERHRELIGRLMDLVVSWNPGLDTYVGVTPPYVMRNIYASAEFERLGIMEKFDEELRADEKTSPVNKAMNAYHFVFSHFYGLQEEFSYSPIVTVRDEQTGLDRSFKLTFDMEFCRLVRKGELPTLSREELQRLKSERMNLDLWKELLPPELIELEGMTLVRGMDVTDREMISLLKFDLLQKDAMDSDESLDRLQHRIRSLMGCPDLRLGLIALERGRSEKGGNVRPVQRSLLLGKEGESPFSNIGGQDLSASIYRLMWERRREVMVSNLMHYERSPYENILLQQGLRNIVLMPMYHDYKFIGIIEIGSPNPGDINSMNISRLLGIESLFATALKRIIDEKENQVQAVIKEHYTVIHPAVEWRFREAARNWIEKRNNGQITEPEQIVFKDIYSLYGLSDIRGSSEERNRSVKEDLLVQLELAHEVIDEASRARPLPILDELGYRIVRKIHELENDLLSGDEARILDFLQSEVESLFDQFAGFAESVRTKVEAYRDALDDELGTVYKQRKNYDETVTLINETISSFIDREEERAQKMFPHYFEKYKTDGVDYNIYVGASLQEDAKFDQIYLRNLRLWQLMMTCGVQWDLDRVRDQFRVPLDVAHLVLAQDVPTSIRFRIDEKLFDVDGAYNIRYEIVKKRIDKALVKGTGERLTQPGQIAIVYSQEKEAEEYKRYVEYLCAAGYLDGEIEELELEDLQGVYGLRALRVRISPQMVIGDTPGVMEQAKEALKNIEV